MKRALNMKKKKNFSLFLKGFKLSKIVSDPSVWPLTTDKSESKIGYVFERTACIYTLLPDQKYIVLCSTRLKQNLN